ncbi:DUF1254 domain-containing protein [Chitinophaga lutea]
MKTIFPLLAAMIAVACNQPSTTGGASNAQNASDSGAVIVTKDNFRRAETDMYFAVAVKQAGTTGRFYHYRQLMPIDDQTVIRTNRDVLYSAGVFDLDAGPVTITLPDPGKRFMSMIMIDEDQYSQTVYAPGTYTYSKDKVGTRYMMLALRTFIDPDNDSDIKQAHALQDAVKTQQADTGKFEVVHWDETSRQRLHDSLVEVGNKLTDFKRMFGTKAEVDPDRHLIGTATGWGGNADKDAMYLNFTPARNDGKTIHSFTVKDVPVDGFWSVSVYNNAGYFPQNDLKVYSLNSVTAKKNTDGSVTVQFGGCDGKIPNCIPIVEGWNYCVRLYLPREEILSGAWKFPEAQPVR